MAFVLLSRRFWRQDNEKKKHNRQGRASFYGMMHQCLLYLLKYKHYYVSVDYEYT